MTLKQFQIDVKSRGWTEAEIRFDVPAPDSLNEFVERIGLAEYERVYGLYVSNRRPLRYRVDYTTFGTDYEGKQVFDTVERAGAEAAYMERAGIVTSTRVVEVR